MLATSSSRLLFVGVLTARTACATVSAQGRRTATATNLANNARSTTLRITLRIRLKPPKTASASCACPVLMSLYERTIVNGRDKCRSHVEEGGIGVVVVVDWALEGCWLVGVPACMGGCDDATHLAD